MANMGWGPRQKNQMGRLAFYKWCQSLISHLKTRGAWDEKNHLRDDIDDLLIRENSKLSKHSALKHLFAVEKQKF